MTSGFGWRYPFIVAIEIKSREEMEMTSSISVPSTQGCVLKTISGEQTPGFSTVNNVGANFHMDYISCHCLNTTWASDSLGDLGNSRATWF